jgi:hypothetical protein
VLDLAFDVSCWLLLRYCVMSVGQHSLTHSRLLLMPLCNCRAHNAKLSAFFVCGCTWLVSKRSPEVQLHTLQRC